MGAFRKSPGGCKCCAATTLTVVGCAGLGLAGASITVKLGGVTVASGTTNAGGHFTAALPAGNYTANVSASRWLGLVGHAFTVPPNNVTIALTTPAAGYHCSMCAYPLASTLFGTDALYGTSPTFTWLTLSNWVAVCVAGTVTGTANVPIQYNTSGANFRSFYGTFFNGLPWPGGCPMSGAPAQTFPGGFNLPIITCPTAGGGAFSATDGAGSTISE